jgi:SAM-dependent methyltransferase
MYNTWGDNTGEETSKTWIDKEYSGFFDTYMNGKGIDIGYKGYLKRQVNPVLPTAKGIDLTTEGYDGWTLPFQDGELDYVYSSHFLEHVNDYEHYISEMFRVVRVGGYVVIVVPHRDLYEKKMEKPSRFNDDHKRFYTASSLLKEIEDAMPINTYRIRHLRENDEGHCYDDAPETHGRWLYEIEVVAERIR